MKDCKNRCYDQRHTWDFWKEEEFISGREKVGLSKSKVETTAAEAAAAEAAGAALRRRARCSESPEVTVSLPTWDLCALCRRYQCLKAL